MYNRMIAIKPAFLLLVALVNAWSPTDSYAPGIVDCPGYLDDNETNSRVGFLRKASSGISDDESDWMQGRDNITIDYLKTFLKDSNLTDLDTNKYIDDIVSNSSARIPKIGIAFSGGGYRALLAAAGEISGIDNRTVGCAEHGLPFLDATSYIAGLSGGSWFVSSLVYNNWTSVQEIIDQTGKEGAIWDFDHNIISPDGINVVDDVEYWDDIRDDIDEKRDAGFNVSMTDPWGRALSYQFFPGLEDYGASMTFTSLRDWEVFTNHSLPFPLVVSDGRTPGQKIVNSNSTVFEFNPFELGSWDKYLDSFVDLKYAGTPMDGGKVSGNGSCWAGLDNTGFVFGSSSTLFNEFLLELNTTDLSGLAYDVADDLLKKLDGEENDIAPWVPNPFYNSPFGESYNLKTSKSLSLTDGGEDDQNIPLYPLLVEDRGVDVIFSFDNSADTDQSWPNGTSLVYTYQRQFSNSSANFAFPYVPGQDTFLHNNLTAKPTFFGCYANNMTDLMEEVGTSYVPPLVVYIANRPWSYQSNTSTFKMSYSDEEKLSMIQNGFEVSTFNNLTVYDDFDKCVSCAILQRSKERQGVEIGQDCKACFDEFCWDGSTYVYEDDSYPDSFTDTGRYNSTISSASSDEISESASGSASSASATVSSISSTKHKNSAPSTYSPFGFLHVLTILLGWIAMY